jgi:outer membrane protein assembly factor BamB
VSGRTRGTRATRRAAGALAALGLLCGAAFGPIDGNGAAAGVTCPTNASWMTAAADLARTGFNPCERVITRTAARGLHLLWTAKLTSVSAAQPTYAAGVTIGGAVHDVLFVADEHGQVQALDTTDGHVLWHRSFGSQTTTCRDMPDSIFGVSGAPVLVPSTNTAFVAGGDDRVYAIELRTGQNKPSHTPIAIGDPTVDHVYGGLTRFGDTLFATTASYCDQGNYFGRVVAIGIAHWQQLATWMVVDPAQNPGQHGGGVWGAGGVSVDSAGPAVYAATGNGLPSETAGYSERVVRLDPTLHVQSSNYAGFTGVDVDYGSTPVLFQPPGCPRLLVAENKSGQLVVYDRDNLAAGPWQTIGVATSTKSMFVGDAAYSSADNMVYVSNPIGSADGVYTNGMNAFSIGADCRLSKAWQHQLGTARAKGVVSPPTVADGVVYEGDGLDHTVVALDSRTGAVLWTSGSTITGAVFAAPTVVDGHVFAVAWDDTVYAFGP